MRFEAKVLAFQSTAFQMPWPDRPEDIDASKPWGMDLAEAISGALCAAGVQAEQPIEGTGGWVVDAVAGGRGFSVFVHWAPLGKKGEDYWVCQVSQRRGVFERLLGRWDCDIMQQLCDKVEAIVRGFEDVVSVKWLSMEEFRALY